MTFNAITTDAPIDDPTFPPLTEILPINVHGDQLLAMMYVAQGKGPHPTIISYHGFPGYEKNIDLAQILRRAGYNVLIFHYRGSWGSQGQYSVTHLLEDAEAVIAYLRSSHCPATCRVDAENLILMGYSLGGFTALLTLAKHPEIKSMAFLVGYNFGKYAKALYGHEDKIREAVAMWQSCIPPLNGITSEQFIDEIIQHRNEWDLMDHAEKLKHHHLLFVGASRDTVSNLSDHHQPLVEVLHKSNCNHLTEVILDTDHDCSCKRIALSEHLLAWLKKQKA